MKGKWRLEVTWLNGDLTVFPGVIGKTIAGEGDKFMTLVYGQKRSIATINMQNVRFFEFIKEKKCE